MSKKISATIFTIIFGFFIASMQGCGKKDEPVNDKSKDGSTTGTVNSDLVKKDDKGTKVTLALKPKKGDILRYKMNAKTTSKENSPMTANKDMSSAQDINYYYTEEVNDVSSAGIITYKIKFDSINVLSSVSTSDSSVSMIYNSNIKDSVYAKPDFIQYNSIMNEEFYARVSPNGEITETYGLEKVYENMFKALGDTLSMEQKESLKESFGKDAIKAVLQQQFQMFPEKEVYQDSSWTRSYETQILIFPVKNILSYKLKDIKTENNQTLLTIDADLSVDFIEKELKEKQMTYKVEDVKTGGKGNIVFNLTKGCTAKKETTTNIELGMKISAGGQSVKTTQNVLTELKVELLNK
ncbi:MAG: hypothetical protein IPJ45_10660 [Ignavibacteria bacterium]|nr:hypothetical protein [Ignavibacteria bacterium]